jgi:pimeloyl-ACP methyl ester carboxylesterase
MTDIPETRYVRSGDADLAYQVFGSGEDLVAIHGLPGHLEVMWELPEYAAFLDRLGTFGRVIMFDKRGTGISDRVPGVPAAEQHMEDIIAVMDAAGSSRASVAGWADGAFMAAMLAATYPDRVSALVLGGLCLKALTGGRQPGLALDPDAIKALSDRIEAGWRQGLVAPVLAPSYTDDEHFRSWWRRLERYSATPSGAAARGRASPGQRGPGHQHGQDAGARLGDRLRRPRAASAEGGPRPMAAVRGGAHLRGAS